MSLIATDADIYKGVAVRSARAELDIVREKAHAKGAASVVEKLAFFCLLAPMALSYLAWAIPGEGTYTRGFSTRSTVTPQGIFFLVSWAVLLSGAVFLGLCVGSSLSKHMESVKSNDDYDYHIALTVIEIVAAIGLLYAYSGGGDLQTIIDAFQNSTMNTISAHLKEGAGIGTLRYASIAAFAVSAMLWMRRQVRLRRVVFDAILLLLQALLSSRLSIFLSLVVLLVFFVSEQAKRIKLSLARLKLSSLGVALLGLMALFAALTLLNYSRNANYYIMYGVENPIMMNIYQILSYLDSPAQVAIGVAGQASFGSALSSLASLNLLIPTFLQGFISFGGASGASYGAGVDVLSSLTTNSVFADVYTAYGLAGLGVVLLAYFLMAICIRLAITGESIPGYLFAGTAIYVFAETWRVYIANQGIIIFVYLMAIVLVALRRPAGEC